MTWAFYIRSVPFTPDVVAGQTSLGGSESTAVGLARALVRRGHRVWIFCADLAPEARAVDAHGVVWEDARLLRVDYAHWHWDVFVHLRMMDLLQAPPQARWQVLWNQDLLESGGVFRKLPANVFSSTWGLDTLAFVSAYHRRQWEGVEPYFARLSWVTRNGYDPAWLPAPETLPARDWRRVIYISRPERGLAPLLLYWPRIKARVPEAELRLCRYSSMYDKDGWGKVCAAFDSDVEVVRREVGGVTWLGELTKPALYRELSTAAVMAYPGVSTFAETSCIAAIEAQACGLPFVGSARGALPETIPSGTLIDGVAEDLDSAYGDAFVDAVVRHLEGCRDQAAWYQETQAAGRAHVTTYTYDALAAHWETQAHEVFAHRWATEPLAIVRQLMREEDHVAALAALDQLADASEDATAMRRECVEVIAAKQVTPELYAERAWPDVEEEMNSGRFLSVSHDLAGCTRVLDVACGVGAAAIRLALDHPEVRVHGVDYSAPIIATARANAARYGLSDRVTFEQLTVYDHEANVLTPEATAWVQAHAGQFDGLFVGEYLEHCADVVAMIDGLEPALEAGGLVLYTMPHGPWFDLRQRTHDRGHTHVHHFELEDIQRVFGNKDQLQGRIGHVGWSARGTIVGSWMITYRVQPGRPAQHRDLLPRILKTRPYRRLSVGILADESALELRRCLETVWPIADEIVIGDSSAPGQTWVAGLAQDYQARRLAIASPTDKVGQPDGFAGARNAVLDACTGEWFLWIDSDEVLHGRDKLRRYLETGPFTGYAIKQWHLMLDAPPHFDTPVRLFKRVPEIRFYGCCHEQPQWGDDNGEIMPALQLEDVRIAHRGYETEDVRKVKSERNLPLLIRNHERFPHRELNYPLDLREFVLRAGIAMRAGDVDAAKELYARAIYTFESRYADPAHRYHQIARPWYEQALEQAAPNHWQFEVALSGTLGNLNGKQARTERVRVRRAEDLEALMRHRVRDAVEAMTEVPPDTRPLSEENRVS